MIASFRRLSKSKVGTAILVVIGILIAGSFVFADLSGFSLGGGNRGATLAKVGSTRLTEQQVSDELQRRLNMIRQQNPQATLAELSPAFEELLSSMIDQAALDEFARDQGFVLSKRLIDAEIANIPAAKGLDGKFSQQAYLAFLSQQRLSDAEVRRLISQEMLQQMMLQPLIASPRIPVGVATPYGSMLLEARRGEVAVVPVSAFTAGLNPTDADLQQFYAANRNRYVVPEQRVLRLARIGPAQVANVAATDQEIAAEYNRNRAAYAPKSVRALSQVVTPSRAAATAIAAAAKANGNLQAAAQGKADTAYASVGEQTREQFSSLAGSQVAAAAFGAAEGAVVGPVQSDFGWHVVKVEDVRDQPGKSLAEARSEIAPRVTEEKRKAALADLADKVQDAIDDNANFEEAAKAAGVAVVQTPLITANGVSRSDPSFKLPPELATVVQQAFELQADDDPELIPISGSDESVLVAPAQIVPAAPAPLASIKDVVARAWVQQQAGNRARAAASQIAAKVGRGVAFAQAVREAGGNLPAPRPVGARRLDLTQTQAPVPPAIQMLFNLRQGQSRMVADSASGTFGVVKLKRIIPGNAALQPALIAKVQRDFQQPTSMEYVRQFMNAIRKEVGAKRDEEAIAEAKKRLFAGS